MSDIVAPGKAGRPVSISKSTHPNAHTSEVRSAACPFACSGDMYAGVPRIMLTPVIIAGFGRFGQIVSRVLRMADIPFTAVDGHTLYRARFGPFVEREAREVCSRLTERGQTCFTVLASSR